MAARAMQPIPDTSLRLLLNPVFLICVMLICIKLANLTFANVLCTSTGANINCSKEGIRNGGVACIHSLEPIHIFT